MKKVFINPLLYLVSVFLFTRFFNLSILPVFNDEAIYLDWGFRQINIPGQLFYSLYDGKPPLLIWVFGIFQKITSDPLLSGRSVSALTGLLTLIGIYKLSEKLSGKSLGVIASLIYLISPIFVFFDRQALLESALSSVGIWSFYFYLKLKENKDLKFAVILGVILGLGMFIKYSAVIFLLGLIILFILEIKKVAHESEKTYLVSSLFIVLGVIFVILLPLLFQANFWGTLGSNSRFSLTFSELLSFPVGTWLTNVFSFFEISFWWFSPVFFVLSIFGIYILFRNKSNYFHYFAGLLMILLLVSRSLQARYVVSFIPLLCIFSGLALEKIKNHYYKFSLFGVSLFIPLIFSCLLHTSPKTFFDNLSGLTKFSTKDEYVTGWTAGFASLDAINFLKDLLKDGNIDVGIRVDAGNPESAIRTYFNASKKIEPIYLDVRLIGEEILQYDCLNSKKPLYFVGRDANLAGLEKFFTEEKRFYNPGEKHFVSVHTLKKNCEGEILELD